MKTRISMRESIDVDRPQEVVFDFVSQGANDPLWRSEVKRMEVSGPVVLGTTWMEYSTFFLVLHTVTPVTLKQLDAPQHALVETPDGHPYWLRSIRTVERLDQQRSRFSYELAFELDLMRQITPILPPPALVRWWYGRRIRRYLRNARQLLES